jgi:hypothetical protein
MAGGIPSDTSFILIFVWVIGVVVLGLVLAYGIVRAGRLRRGERERLDRNTRRTQQVEDPQKRGG